MPDPADVAVQRFRDGYNCSQAVFSAIADQFELPLDTSLRIAGLFGGGIARTGEMCGAVTGALMALGLRYGAVVAGNEDAKNRQYDVARALMTRFAERHGSCRCRDLLGRDISTPEGRQQARDAGLFADFCPGLVADSARLVAEILRGDGRA